MFSFTNKSTASNKDVVIEFAISLLTVPSGEIQYNHAHQMLPDLFQIHK